MHVSSCRKACGEHVVLWLKSVFYHSARLCFRWFVLPRLGFRVYGREHLKAALKAKGPFMVVSNHQSYLDPFLISAHFPVGKLIHWWAMEDLYNPRVLFEEYVAHKPRLFGSKTLGKAFAWALALSVAMVVKFTPTIMVNPNPNEGAKVVNREAVRSAKKIFAEGGGQGIFPQGGIEKTKGREFTSLFASLARSSGAVIVPVCLNVKEKTTSFRPAMKIDRSDERSARELADIVARNIYEGTE